MLRKLAEHTQEFLRDHDHTECPLCAFYESHFIATWGLASVRTFSDFSNTISYARGDETPEGYDGVVETVSNSVFTYHDDCFSMPLYTGFDYLIGFTVEPAPAHDTMVCIKGDNYEFTTVLDVNGECRVSSVLLPAHIFCESTLTIPHHNGYTPSTCTFVGISVPSDVYDASILLPDGNIAVGADCKYRVRFPGGDLVDDYGVVRGCGDSGYAKGVAIQHLLNTAVTQS